MVSNVARKFRRTSKYHSSSPPCNPYTRVGTLLASHYSIIISTTDVRTSYIPLVPTFTARSCKLSLLSSCSFDKEQVTPKQLLP